VVSPFIKFKNASKETIDASDELVEEIRRALMQAGQKLSRHIKSEMKEADLERKLAHIEQFGPILVEKLVFLARKKKAEEGLKKILGRDSEQAVSQLEEAQTKLALQKKKEAKKLGLEYDEDPQSDEPANEESLEHVERKAPKKTGKKQKK